MCHISLSQPRLFGPSTYLHNFVLSFPLISPESVSVQVGLVRRNHLHHQYHMPVAELRSFILPSLFFLPACQLAAAKHQNYWRVFHFIREVESKEFVDWLHWISQKGCLSLCSVELYEDPDSPSYDLDDSMMSVRPSCDGADDAHVLPYASHPHFVSLFETLCPA
ncbi:unnamed protein product [Protopolystoma xenopodis]|uniref:Uncharacterized protein n=1 Tax=Protopolystoma xenopodis TaxID=117903 RepID=A0A3S5A5S0_9PLAT|nr:unnamed protein product [Protopolystoma xenopodis]